MWVRLEFGMMSPVTQLIAYLPVIPAYFMRESRQFGTTDAGLRATGVDAGAGMTLLFTETVSSSHLAMGSVARS